MIQELNRVINYIEEHLSDDLSSERLAAVVGVSDFHLKTIFFHLSGVTLAEYIKNRRLAEANLALLKGERVTDVAYASGYQSLDGFGRAFRKWSGYLPSDIAENRICKTFPKLSFFISVEGGVSMDFRIVDKPAFTLAGVSKRVPLQFEGVNKAIVELAQSITQEQRDRMHALQNLEPREIVNASYDSDTDFLTEEGELTHLIGVLTTSDSIDECLDTVRVKEHTWAVFPNEGPFPATLQETMAKVYAEWLPSTCYELVKAPTFSFTKMDAEKDNYAYSEVWIAVCS